MAIMNPDDALGIASRDRAHNRRWATFAETGNMRALDGGSMMPSWDSFLERLHESGAKVRAGGSFNEPYQPTFDPSRGQSSAVASAAPLVDKQGAVSGYKIQGRSQKPTMANPSSIDGILRASKRR